MTEQNQNKKALWIFPNFKESIDELPKSQRALVWQAVCEIGLGYEFDIKKCTTSQKMCIKLIYPLLKLRNVGGSIVSGEKRNPNGKNGLNDCNKTIREDNPYPNPKDNIKDNPEDNSLYKKEQEQEKEQEKERFRLFVQEYPKKVNNSDFEFFCEALKKISFDKLLEQTKNYSGYVEFKGTDERYVKSAKNWLKEECWKNDYDYDYISVEWH